jgi:hypothetical protein
MCILQELCVQHLQVSSRMPSNKQTLTTTLQASLHPRIIPALINKSLTPAFRKVVFTFTLAIVFAEWHCRSGPVTSRNNTHNQHCSFFSIMQQNQKPALFAIVSSLNPPHASHADRQ